MANDPSQPEWASPPVLASSLPWTAAPKVLTGHNDAVQSLAFSPDGSTLASVDLAGKIRLWDLPTGVLAQDLPGPADSVNAVAFSPDGSLLAAGGSQRAVWLWDLSTGGAQILTGHRDAVVSMTFSPDGSLLQHPPPIVTAQ